ncbi:MAG: hypothetical protein SPI12_02170 [Actinomycetaceae bacterium]|nr:hypothetical protein [Actinomycetaceae bacterium]MDY6082654.1 hypothetical protein [Actinomycetaceae bacterium]
MTVNLLWLVSAFGGGAFGAAIGGQTAFIFAGFAYLVGLGAMIAGFDTTPLMDAIVFGPVFGPHIAFAGGVAAAAYAAKKGYMAKGQNGRDIISALAGLGHADVLVVGGVTGMVGYLLNQFIVWVLPTITTSHPDMQYGNSVIGSTDTVALTITIMAIVARYMWGSGGLTGSSPLPKLAVGEGKAWVPYMESWGMAAFTGFYAALMSSFATVTLLYLFLTPDNNLEGYAQLIGWGLGAVSLLFNSLGMKTPIIHHTTLIGSIAALRFAPLIAGTSVASQWSTGTMVSATVIGAVAGCLAGLLGELLARTTCAGADTHIDPPAFTIWIGTTAVYAIAGIAA